MEAESNALAHSLVMAKQSTDVLYDLITNSAFEKEKEKENETF